MSLHLLPYLSRLLESSPGRPAQQAINQSSPTPLCPQLQTTAKMRTGWHWAWLLVFSCVRPFGSSSAVGLACGIHRFCLTAFSVYVGQRLPPCTCLPGTFHGHRQCAWLPATPPSKHVSNKLSPSPPGPGRRRPLGHPRAAKHRHSQTSPFRETRAPRPSYPSVEIMLKNPNWQTPSP